MKRNITVLLITLLLVFLSSCKAEEPFVVDCEKYPTHVDCITIYEKEPTCEEDPKQDICETETEDFIEIYYLNDFHGALDATSDTLGIANIANLVVTKKEQYPGHILFLAGGDMLQGSAISNYYEGASTITLLNESLLDAFTVGNHEFDWGLDTILAYADGNEENGEADFPFLGANIIEKATGSLPNGIEPYAIFELSGHKVGVIGTIGYGLEYSIAQSKIDSYQFINPVDIVKNLATQLRTENGCDLVLLVAHDPGDYNDTFASLIEDETIDAIFNGHSHQAYATKIGDTPILQSGSSGEYVGYVRFTFTNEETTVTVQNLDIFDEVLLSEPNTQVAQTLEMFHEETDPIFNFPIIVSGDNYSTYELSDWLARLMRISTGSDVAFHNYGGTRTDLSSGEQITLGTLYQIWPFDNVIKTVWLDGQIVQNLINGTLAYDTDITTFEPGVLYLVATNDYIFDKTTYPFLNGSDPVNTGILIRDLVESEMQEQAILFPNFSTDNPIQSVFEDPAMYNYIIVTDSPLNMQFNTVPVT
jgi:2',3'-cyclic-nucleotide 2'-phosphodiesterase (5'-nucleotidase family)